MSPIVQLRQQIEALALEVVVTDSADAAAAARWVAACEAIHAQALSERAGDVAAAADTLLASLPLGQPAALASALQAGIVRLQQAIEREGRGPDPSAAASLALDPELMSDFVLESREHLAAIESQLLILESDPHASEALNAVFRGFHTIKGLAGFLELWDVQKIAHETETVLDGARSSRYPLTPAACDVILESADYLRRSIQYLEAGTLGQRGSAPPPGEPLIERIRALAGAPSPSPLESGPAPEPTDAAAGRDGTAAPPEQPAPPGEVSSGHTAAMAVKVNTAKLDYLVDMAGEMVIAESLVRHDPDLATVKSQALQRKLAQVRRITAELQKTAMAMRLVSIGPLFRRMSRLVRDLSRQTGKQAQLETEGDEIELDRNVVEELGDPLMHMVRNAVDHGLESPAQRAAAGKNPVGRLRLKAQHQAGQVVIEIADDGRGLDVAAVRAKAVERGLLAADQECSESEIFNLIFEPGFSTAARVTNVSGRGVGMDVVRRHIEKLRGRIEIRSTAGEGTCFFLKLPLTLAIIDGLVVGVGSERYVVPLFAVREMFRPVSGTLWTVEQRAEMALVRGNLLPVFRLARLFGVKPRSEDPLESILVVAEVGGSSYCLLVDELIGKQEVVIKSLGPAFRDVTSLAGGAIMGDGRVGLILDLDRLLKDKGHEGAR